MTSLLLSCSIQSPFTIDRVIVLSQSKLNYISFTFHNDIHVIKVHYYPSSRDKSCINKIKEFYWLIAGLYWAV